MKSCILQYTRNNLTISIWNFKTKIIKAPDLYIFFQYCKSKNPRNSRNCHPSAYKRKLFFISRRVSPSTGKEATEAQLPQEVKACSPPADQLLLISNNRVSWPTVVWFPSCIAKYRKVLQCVAEVSRTCHPNKISLPSSYLHWETSKENQLCFCKNDPTYPGPYLAKHKE